MQEETGKVRADAALEAFYLLDAINFWSSRAPRFLADETVTPHVPLLRHRRAKVVYHPFPVAGVISPWNFPLILSLGDGIPALAAGCALVIKPSEFTPLTLMEIVRAWKEEIGAPDVLEVVNGMGETGGALVDACDFIQFTGSERTGSGRGSGSTPSRAILVSPFMSSTTRSPSSQRSTPSSWPWPAASTWAS